MTKPSPNEVEDYLGEIKFPISKDKLLKKLLEENTPESILNIIRQLPDRDYSSRKDIMSVLGDLEPNLFQELRRG